MIVKNRQNIIGHAPLMRACPKTIRFRPIQCHDAVGLIAMTQTSKMPAGLTDLVTGCHGGRALVLGDMPVTTRPMRSRFMRLLQGGTTVTTPTSLRRGLAGDHSAEVRVSAVMRINSVDIEMLVKNDPVFLSQFVIVQPGDTGGLFHPGENGTMIAIPEETLLEDFSGAVARVMAARRSGVQMGGWLRDADAARKFQDQRQAFMRELEASGDPAASVFAELPMAIAWLLTQLYPSMNLDGSILELAVSCSRIILKRHTKLLSGFSLRQKQSAEQLHEEKILRRVAQCGPSTLREVVRGFDRQNHEVHAPAIQSLLESGKLLVFDDHLSLAAAAVGCLRYDS
ncbi:MAG: hypothetical protein WCO57_06605 [Verrucomicrobiota bacterium]